MTLLNNFDIAALQGEASRHNLKVLEKDLQPYNDILFNIIRNEIESNPDSIIDQFRRKIRESTGHVKTVSVPLWTYNTRFFNTSRQDYNRELLKLNPVELGIKCREDRELMKLHRDNGWHWMVGVSSGKSYQWNDDYTGVTLQENWTLKQVPVDLVLRKTDILLRLSNLFDGEHVWVTREYLGYVHDDDRCRVDKMVLKAHFHVDGLKSMAGRVRVLRDVRAKYASHSDAFFEEGDRTVLTGPGLEPPVTPPSSPVDAAPVPRAPKARRSRCPSCDGLGYESE